MKVEIKRLKENVIINLNDIVSYKVDDRWSEYVIEEIYYNSSHNITKVKLLGKYSIGMHYLDYVHSDINEIRQVDGEKNK